MTTYKSNGRAPGLATYLYTYTESTQVNEPSKYQLAPASSVSGLLYACEVLVSPTGSSLV
jgi:hypothetical protein